MNDKEQQYRELVPRIEACLSGETDEIACLATVACEVFHQFEAFHWVGFYRVTSENMLTVGPYQGGHGCLRIPFTKGVCGSAATTKTIQLIDDVNAIQNHIACSSTTQSELVIPLLNTRKEVTAVFDIDSDNLKEFDALDAQYLQDICSIVEKCVYR